MLSLPDILASAGHRNPVDVTLCPIFDSDWSQYLVLNQPASLTPSPIPARPIYIVLLCYGPLLRPISHLARNRKAFDDPLPLRHKFFTASTPYTAIEDNKINLQHGDVSLSNNGMELEVADIILTSALTPELREVCLRLMPASDAPEFRQMISDVAEGSADDNKAEVFLSREQTVKQVLEVFWILLNVVVSTSKPRMATPVPRAECPTQESPSALSLGKLFQRFLSKASGTFAFADSQRVR